MKKEIWFRTNRLNIILSNLIAIFIIYLINLERGYLGFGGEYLAWAGVNVYWRIKYDIEVNNKRF